jgi:hypothetical protein
MKRKIKIAALVGLVLFGAFLFHRNQARNEIASTNLARPSTFPADPSAQLFSDETIHLAELKRAQQVEYRSYRDIGSGKKNNDRKKPLPHVPQPEPWAQEPQVAKLPLSFFGYGTVPNGSARRAFLTDGQEVYILVEGETLLSRFRILRVNDSSLDFEDLATGRKSSAPLDEGSAPGSRTVA